MAIYNNEQSRFVANKLGISLIPEDLANSKEMAFYAIHPPTPGSHFYDLISPDTNTIQGQGRQLGYSTTTRIMDRTMYVNDDNCIPVVVEAERSNKSSAELDLATAIATRLLVEVLMYPKALDALPTEATFAIAQIIVDNVANANSRIIEAQSHHPKFVIADLLPHLCTLPNPSTCNDIKRSKTASIILTTSKKGLSNLKSMIEATSAHRKPTLIIDASGNTSSESLYPIISKSLECTPDVKIVGPKQNVYNIMTGNIVNIEWDETSLLSLGHHSINNASSQKFHSLTAVSELELKGARLAPEEIIIHQMIESNKMLPGILIHAINNILFAAASSDTKVTRSILDQELQKI